MQSEGYLFTIADTRDTLPTDILLHGAEKPYNLSINQAQEIGMEWVIAKEIAEKHGGWINVMAHPEGGAVCRIYLPFGIELPSPKKSI
jgi:signal transduction histidine kinase